MKKMGVCIAFTTFYGGLGRWHGFWKSMDFINVIFNELSFIYSLPTYWAVVILIHSVPPIAWKM